jgi:4-amino-4-deoxy-L-arabinose transferase-like glycosyltransferase
MGTTIVGIVRTPLAAFAALLIAASLFGDLGRGLWTPDEPREAGISREMYAKPGIVPTLNGQPFVQKPPLYYWTAAAAFRLAGGPSVAAARAVSATAALLALLVVFCWVSRAASIPLAAFATVILGTTSAFVTSAHWVRIDAVLLLLSTTAVWCAWERIDGLGGKGFLALFYTALVLALWTKGLIGPVLVLSGLLAHGVITGRTDAVIPLRPNLGVVVLASAVAVLTGAIAWSGGAEALSSWLWVNHVERFVRPAGTGHAHAPAYYAWVLPLAVLPWLVPFVWSMRPKAPMWRADRAHAALVRYAAAMTVGPLVVLSLAASKREVYLLPLLPPLAVLLGAAVLDRIETETPGWLARAGDWLQAVLLGAMGLAPPLAIAVVQGKLTVAAAVFLACGLANVGALVVFVRRRDPERAFWSGAASAGLGLIGACVLLVPAADAVKDLQPLMASIDGIVPAGVPVCATGADETLFGIVGFATGRRVVAAGADGACDQRFVVVQRKGGAPAVDVSSLSHERVLSRDFGPRRTIELWRRREPQATVTSFDR